MQSIKIVSMLSQSTDSQQLISKAFQRFISFRIINPKLKYDRTNFLRTDRKNPYAETSIVSESHSIRTAKVHMSHIMLNNREPKWL